MIALYLLRHAHAGDPAKWRGDDADRPLSEKGHDQAERVGRLLKGADESPDLIITSPKVRAAETATIVAKALKVGVVVDERLAGMLDSDVVTEILMAAGPAERPCIVGHDPDFSALLGEMTGVAAIQMRKGALARVDCEGGTIRAGRGLLRFLVPPEILASR
jgi:phosphohistidine phosphatase